MTALGLISDTHGTLPPTAVEALQGVDEILHAGDVGGPEIEILLGAIAPVTAVAGNTDPVGSWPGRRVLLRSGRTLVLIHDIGDIDRPSLDLLRSVRRACADLVVFGHSHRPADYTMDGIRFVNPGSPCAPRGAGTTVARVTLSDDGGIEVVHVGV